MEYSKEYVAKIVGALIMVVVTVLPLVGINLVPDQIETVTTVATGLITLGLWLYTMYRQSRKENLSVTGAYTYNTPTYLRERE